MRLSWPVLLVALTTSLLFGKAQAQQAVLDSLIDLALENNPELAAAAHIRQSTAQTARAAGALPDPALSVGFLNLPASSLALDETPMSGVSLGLSQKIPWPGKLDARTDLADALHLQSQAGHRLVRNRIVREVTEAYVDYSFRTRSLPIVSDYLTLLKATREIAEARYATGETPAQDVLRVSSMISRTEIRLVQAEQKQWSSILRLRQAVSDTTITTALPFALDEPTSEEADRSSIERNPMLSQAALVVEEAKAQRRLARQEYAPDFTLGFDYRIRQAIPGDPVRGADYLTFKVGVSLPLWFFAKQKHKVRSAEQVVLATKQRQRSIRDRLSAQYDDAVSRMSVVLESLRRYDNSLVPEATAAARAAEAAYEVGEADFNALLSAQSDAFEIRIERLDLLRQHHKMKAALTEISGGAFERNRK
jgi:outer membrane protein TolC